MVDDQERKEAMKGNLETIKERLRGLINRLDGLGGVAGVCLYDESGEGCDAVAEHNPDMRFFAASTNKLAIAFALAHERQGDMPHEHALIDRLPGGGRFDADNSPDEPGDLISEIDLLADMLKRSGNTAAVMLKSAVGAGRINELLRQYGHDAANLTVQPDGSSHLGYTTPRASVRLMRAVTSDDGASNLEIMDAILRALAYNARPTGIRTGLTVEDYHQMGLADVVIFNKGGEYNGDEEVGDPVRHDVGIILDGDGRRVMYAVMAQAPASVIAEYFRHQATAEILAYATGLKKVGISKHLAQHAFRRLSDTPHTPPLHLL